MKIKTDEETERELSEQEDTLFETVTVYLHCDPRVLQKICGKMKLKISLSGAEILKPMLFLLHEIHFPQTFSRPSIIIVQAHRMHGNQMNPLGSNAGSALVANAALW